MFQVFLGVSTYVLQVFHLDVAYVCNVFQNIFEAFSQVFQTLVSSVSSVLFCMSQLLYLDVSKVDQMLHMWCVWEAPGDAGDVRDITGDVQSGTSPLLVAHSRADAIGARSLCGHRRRFP
jgi:hypothetical protein